MKRLRTLDENPPGHVLRALVARGRGARCAGVFPYTLYFALDPGGILGGLPGFIPGVLGVGALLAAGFRPGDCYLRAAPISRGGFFVLVAVTFLLVPILSAGQWVGWSPLPALLTTFKGRILLALAAHSALFALWHLQMLVQIRLLPLA